MDIRILWSKIYSQLHPVFTELLGITANVSRQKWNQKEKAWKTHSSSCPRIDSYGTWHRSSADIALNSPTYPFGTPIVERCSSSFAQLILCSHLIWLPEDWLLSKRRQFNLCIIGVLLVSGFKSSPLGHSCSNVFRSEWSTNKEKIKSCNFP